MKPHNPRFISEEYLFTNFLKNKGTCHGKVFKVTAKINFGPILYKRYYCLIDGKKHEVFKEFKNKMTCYKNYKCDSCNTFFDVDIFIDDKKTCSNYHYLRNNCNADYSNDSLIKSFWEEANK